jgi:hypothetical protein
MKNGSLRVVAGKDEVSPLLQPQSPARIKLAQLINDRLTIEAKLRDLAASAERLREAQRAEGQATAALANFEATETAAMAEWSRSPPSSPAPVSNPGKRDDLLAAIRTASAQAGAARKAEAANTAEQTRENEALQRLNPQTDLAVVAVIVDEVDPLIRDFEEANRALAAKAGKIAEAAEIITQIAHGTGNLDRARPAFAALEKLNERIRVAFARPAPEIGSHRAAWSALAANLRSDPLAKLKD